MIVAVIEKIPHWKKTFSQNRKVYEIKTFTEIIQTTEKTVNLLIIIVTILNVKKNEHGRIFETNYDLYIHRN